MRYEEDGDDEEDEGSLRPLPSFLGNYATFEDNGRVLATPARSTRLEDDEDPEEMLPIPASMLFPTSHNPKGKGRAPEQTSVGDDSDAGSCKDSVSVSASRSSWDHANAMADFENDNPVRLQCPNRRTVTIMPPSPEVVEPCVAHIEDPNGNILYAPERPARFAVPGSPSSSSNVEWVTPPQTRYSDFNTSETGSVIYDGGNLVNALLIINDPTQETPVQDAPSTPSVTAKEAPEEACENILPLLAQEAPSSPPTPRARNETSETAPPQNITKSLYPPPAGPVAQALIHHLNSPTSSPLRQTVPSPLKTPRGNPHHG